MDVIRCRIDVGQHRVDRGVGVWQKARGVATHRMEPADRVAEAKEILVTLGNGGRGVRRVPSGVTRDGRHALEDCVQPADVHLAQVKQKRSTTNRWGCSDAYAVKLYLSK